MQLTLITYDIALFSQCLKNLIMCTQTSHSKLCPHIWSQKLHQGVPGNEIEVHTSYRCIIVDWSVAVVVVVSGGGFDVEFTILRRKALGTNE